MIYSNRYEKKNQTK